MPNGSLWLPDHCVHTNNILEVERAKRGRARPAAAHRAVGGRPRAPLAGTVGRGVPAAARTAAPAPTALTGMSGPDA